MQADYGTCELPTDRGLARAPLTPDEDIYRDWLLKAQAASPDEEVRKTELVLDAYNVVDKHEYPPAARLDPGHPQAYNAIMMTGSSESPELASRGEGWNLVPLQNVALTLAGLIRDSRLLPAARCHAHAR